MKDALYKTNKLLSMKKELIEELFKKFENACHIYESIECWSARELQEILGYSKWDNFINVIEKSKNPVRRLVLLFLNILPMSAK